MTATTLKARGVLLDLDGTLISSTPVCEAVWEKWAEEYDVDLEQVFKDSHGIRTSELLRYWCKIKDPVLLERATEKFESDVLAEAERQTLNGMAGFQLLPGVHRLLVALDMASRDKTRWAIVTSATSAYARRAITSVDLPVPERARLITADAVTRGKPHPEPYIMGAAALGLHPSECIVIEDAPTGVRAGVASGAQVIAVCTSHARSKLEGLGAHCIVDDLSTVSLHTVDDGVAVVIR